MSLRQGLQAGRSRLAVIAGILAATGLIHFLDKHAADDGDHRNAPTLSVDRRAIAELAWAEVRADPSLAPSVVRLARQRATRLGVDTAAERAVGPSRGTSAAALLDALDRRLPTSRR